ncbi:MAG: hypothetical protein WCT04_17190 [Planctomycetota bacterium]
MHRLLAVSILLLALGCIAHAADANAPSEKVMQHLGAATVKMILAAEKGEVFRVGNLEYEKAGTLETLGGRLIQGTGIVMSKDFLERLKATLLAENTYFKSDSKGTVTGVGYRLTLPSGVVEISCCLKKGNVWIVTKNAEGTVLTKGDRRGFRDDTSSPMRILAAEALPEDADVQKCKPK